MKIRKEAENTERSNAPTSKRPMMGTAIRDAHTAWMATTIRVHRACRAVISGFNELREALNEGTLRAFVMLTISSSQNLSLAGHSLPTVLIFSLVSSGSVLPFRTWRTGNHCRVAKLKPPGSSDGKGKA